MTGYKKDKISLNKGIEIPCKIFDLKKEKYLQYNDEKAQSMHLNYK